MRNLILGLSLSVAFIVGCLAGPVIQPTITPPVKAAPGTPKWQYKCTLNYGSAMTAHERAEKQANYLGHYGYELAGVGGTHGSVFCFKRRRP